MDTKLNIFPNAKRNETGKYVFWLHDESLDLTQAEVDRLYEMLKTHAIPAMKDHDVYMDFCKCSDVAQRLDSMNPEAPGAFTGTVSERLDRGVDFLMAKKDALQEVVDQVRATAKSALGNLK